MEETKLSKLIKQIGESGLAAGILVLLGVILYGGYKFTDKLLNNHLDHLQASINKIEESSQKGFEGIQNELRMTRDVQSQQTDRIIQALK